jgi:hypothetical protein
VKAVMSEPLSRADSLLSGINTGIFMGFAENTLAVSHQSSMNSGDFSLLPLD